MPWTMQVPWAKRFRPRGQREVGTGVARSIISLARTYEHRGYAFSARVSTGCCDPWLRCAYAFSYGANSSSLGTIPWESGRNIDGYWTEAGRNMHGTSMENGRKMGRECEENGRTWKTHSTCNGIWTERGRNTYGTSAGHGRNIAGKWTADGQTTV